MATPRQGNQCVWLTDFLDALAGPLDVDRFQAMFDAHPREIPELETVGRAFLDRAGPQLVLNFLKKATDTADTATTQCKYYVYNVLIDLTCAGEVCDEVRAELVRHGVLQPVAADINSYRVPTCQASWRLVEMALTLLHNCTILTDPVVKSLLQDQCLETVVQAATVLEDPTLLFNCIRIIISLGKVDRRPAVSCNMIATWAGWMGSCDFEKNWNKYYVQPDPTASKTQVSSVFSILNNIAVTAAQKQSLAEALQPHGHYVQDVLIKGDDCTKKLINTVLEQLVACKSTSRFDYVRDIMLKSGRTVSQIMQMEPDPYARLAWVSLHVPDINCCCKLGMKLGLPLDEIKAKIALNRDLPTAVAIELLTLWRDRPEAMSETSRSSLFCEALKVITDTGLLQQVTHEEQEAETTLLKCLVEDPNEYQVLYTREPVATPVQCPGQAKPTAPPSSRTLSSDESLEPFDESLEPFPIQCTDTNQGMEPPSGVDGNLTETGAAHLPNPIPTGKPIENRFLRTLSRKLPDNGFNGFAEEFLGLEYAIVQRTESDCYKQAQDKIYKLLLLWKNKTRGSANALRAIFQRAASDNAIIVSDEVYAVLDSANIE